MPPWEELADSPPPRPEEPEPTQPQFGWQQRASFCGRRCGLASVTVPEHCCVPLASASLTALPTSKATRVDAQLFRVFLCRRLHLAPPRTCRCGRQLDKFGHHRAACAVAGVLGRRGFPLVAAAQVCREAGARVSTNLPSPGHDLAEFNNLDGRRLEVVADGLTLWHGAQLAIDTTLVSPLRRDGSPRARRLTMVGQHWMTLVVERSAPIPNCLETEEGFALWWCRWSVETANFLSVWRRRSHWIHPTCCRAGFSRPSSGGGALFFLACSAVRAFSASLLDRRPVPGLGVIPSVHDVVRDARYV